MNSSDPQTTSADPAARSLLLVEDEPVIAELLKTVMSRAGFDVEAVHRVEDAVAILRERDFDFCISDFLLPDQTGLDLARELGSLRPGLRMILITAYLEPDLERQVRAEPAVVDIVPKPMDVFQLRDRVDALTASAKPDGEPAEPVSTETTPGEPRPMTNPHHESDPNQAGGDHPREMEC